MAQVAPFSSVQGETELATCLWKMLERRSQDVQVLPFPVLTILPCFQ